jgi:uncharacterized circularly permuted ATP-grasp superfamily protein
VLQAVAYDEAFGAAGDPRPQYERALAALEAVGPGAVTHAGDIAVGDRPLPLDPVPRIFTAAEWAPLAAALSQRARALDAWVADAYGARRAVAEGVVPGALLASCHYFEPQLPSLDTGVAIVGFDVVRLPDGSFRVLEDNTLTPGHAAVPAARERLTLWRHVDHPPAGVHTPARRLLTGLLDGARPAILGDPGGTWELRWLSAFLGVPLVDHPGDHDLVWQRTGEDRLTDTALGRMLLPRLAGGSLRVVSRPGCGVADDKALMPHVGDLIRFFCGEEPLLEDVPTAPAVEAAEEPEDWVFKPRAGAGARGVVFGEVPENLTPGGWVAQRRVPLSLHPTVTADGLEPRPVDLRAFAVRTPGGGYEVIPGGVSRFASERGGAVVNTSAGGGVKDVWVLPER